MKRSLLLVNLFAVTACLSNLDPEENPRPDNQIETEDTISEEDSGALPNEDDSANDTDTPSYSIEDKWLWSPSEFREHANTMYEYVDGIRYTSYADCWPEDCTDADFYALDESDRIPGTHSYTWDENTQTIFDEDGNPTVVSFACDGGIMVGDNSGQLWRLSSTCE